MAHAIIDASQKKKKIDFDKITRQILSSEPPRPSDIVLLVDFCKTWGGAVTQRHVLDALAFIQEKGSTLIVASTFFRRPVETQIQS